MYAKIQMIYFRYTASMLLIHIDKQETGNADVGAGLVPAL
jgi:hypothetical protein